MQTVLIVEDEKMIRQGIRTMVQRSGVPVELVLECSNGQAAIEIAEKQEIDVMFTDIRMPKMDGIQLVQRIRECAHIPIIVAISGYDDFNYAVEMLRNGVREYLLKPIEREKITELMQKFEEELEQKRVEQRRDEKISVRQIRYLMETDGIPAEEVELFEKRQQNRVTTKDYVICVGPGCASLEAQESILLEHMEQSSVCICGMDTLMKQFGKAPEAFHIGVSEVHTGLGALRSGYLEAVDARRRAFAQNQNMVHYSDPRLSVAEALREQAKKYLTDAAKIQRVQLIGTDRMEELQRQWEILFQETERGRLTPDELNEQILDFTAETKQIYVNSLSEESTELLDHLERVYTYETIYEYGTYFMGCIAKLQENIHMQADNNQTKNKLQQAVRFIHENYAKDLNMAVVSNHISMNYSLFSYAFKQYTGSNFVNYLKEIRLQEARRLLVETDMKIIEISQAVGYENEKNFMKIFKSTCGVSATEYRKNMSGAV